MAVPASEWATWSGASPWRRRRLPAATRSPSQGHQRFLGPLLAGLGPGAMVLGPPPDARAETLAALASDYDVLHVDHYEVDAAVLDALGPGPLRRAGTQPEGARPLLSNVCDGCFGARPADLAVDPTPGAEGTPAPAATTWSLRGGRFTPIRQAILHSGATSTRPRRGRPRSRGRATERPGRDGRNRPPGLCSARGGRAGWDRARPRRDGHRHARHGGGAPRPPGLVAARPH